MEEIEDIWKRYCQAKDRAEQYMFVFIAMFDKIICDEYNDLKKNFSEDHKQLFLKNVRFVLSKIS